jgi:metal-sulfur cluster biosynthetic enzyme
MDPSKTMTPSKSEKLEEETATTEYLWEVLKTVRDPEIGVDIVNLGMVYGIDLERRGEKFTATVTMTLTSPGCPLADYIAADVRDTIEGTGKCSPVTVDFVFDPPWNPDMITAEGKMQLGLL